MPAISIMIKPSSSLCNLRCKYCFYHSLAEGRESFSSGFMSRITAENLIKNALSYANGESVYFTFQGGEPLLVGLDFYKNFVSVVNEKNIKSSSIYYGFQTNGTLIDDEWAKFFKQNNFLLGLSLDGAKRDNTLRVDSDGNPSFDKAVGAIDILKANKVDFNILVTTTANTAKNIESIYAWLKKYELKYLQFIPCLRPFGESVEDERYMSADDYASFLIKLFRLYVKDFLAGNYVSIRAFDNYVNAYYGLGVEQCGMTGGCSRQFVIEGGGEVYPCDFYCIDEWLLGNINQDGFEKIASSDRAKNFLKSSFEVLPDKCNGCAYYRFCRGCRRVRDYDYCEAYRKFFSKCLPLFRYFKNM